MPRKCVYAGSFDPPTNGHMWMIENGSRLFDELVLAIGTNPEKKSMFSVSERLGLLRDLSKHYGNITVGSYQNQFLMHYAKSIGAKYVLRGIRSYKDYEYESGIKRINDSISSSVTTVFLMPPDELSHISSSIVKGLIGPSGWEDVVEHYVPRSVYSELLKRFSTPRRSERRRR